MVMTRLQQAGHLKGGQRKKDSEIIYDISESFFDFDGKVQRHDLSRIKEMLVYKGGQLRSVFNFQLFIYTGKSLFYCNFCEMKFFCDFLVGFS